MHSATLIRNVQEEVVLLLRRQSKGFARDTSKLRSSVQPRAPPRVPTPPPAPAPPASRKSAQPGGVRMHAEKPSSQKRAIRFLLSVLKR